MARTPKAAAVPPSPKVMYFVCACDWAIAHPRRSANRRVRRSTDNEHAHATALLMQIKWQRIGRVTATLFLVVTQARSGVACGTVRSQGDARGHRSVDA